jgi:hypothetical protein
VLRGIGAFMTSSATMSPVPEAADGTGQLQAGGEAGAPVTVIVASRPAGAGPASTVAPAARSSDGCGRTDPPGPPEPFTRTRRALKRRRARRGHVMPARTGGVTGFGLGVGVATGDGIT